MTCSTLAALQQIREVRGPPWLAKNGIYIIGKKKKKKKLYVKLTYYDNSNKNVDHPVLRITKSWVQQK